MEDGKHPYFYPYFYPYSTPYISPFPLSTLLYTLFFALFDSESLISYTDDDSPPGRASIKMLNNADKSTPKSTENGGASTTTQSRSTLVSAFMMAASPFIGSRGASPAVGQSTGY